MRPKTIGEPMAADTIQTIAMVNETRVLLLCLAYLIGRVTAINLDEKYNTIKTINQTTNTYTINIESKFNYFIYNQLICSVYI